MSTWRTKIQLNDINHKVKTESIPFKKRYLSGRLIECFLVVSSHEFLIASIKLYQIRILFEIRQSRDCKSKPSTVHGLSEIASGYQK